MNKSVTLKAIMTLTVLMVLLFSKMYGQKNSSVIKMHLAAEREKNKWLESDINDFVITDEYTDATTGLTYDYIQQRHNHIAVFNAISVFVIKEGAVLYFKPGLIDHIANKVNADKPAITPEAAVKFALNLLGKAELYTIKLLSHDMEKNIFVYEAPAISNTPVKVQLVYRLTERGVLLAWDVSVEMKAEPHWWNVRVDAVTGAIIDKNDFTVECKFDNTHEHDDVYLQGSGAYAMPVVVPDYRVFAFPLEAQSFGSRTLLSDPADATASPYGWHDEDGITGGEYTITRGNNVHAYEDANNDNLPGYSPDGGSSLHFDFPFTSNATPVTNQDASLTNLFYDNNLIHDYLYQLGFTEAAGNFQQNNYGRGGLGGDNVKAEGLDGSGTNNANFNTPPDGSPGRMQMYLFTGNNSTCTSLNISSSGFTGSMTTGTADFTGIGSVNDTLILVNDGVSPVTDACTAITNNIAGKIALIDRGTCNFRSKALAAQNAGAVGVIIANNVIGAPMTMTGSPALSIPCVSVSLADGNTLKTALTGGVVMATITTCTANQIDGSFDNGIVAHEYGHGLSNRLTGGPSQASCLINGEQGGEGWSDWLALMMTIEPGDQGSDARGIGTYAKGQPVTGPGIRRYPYSTNMSVNPQTYGHLALSSQVHNVGEIWCDAIWDMSWLLIDQYGFNNNPANTTAGNNIAMRLVLEGMKLQPCGPGFLDARDAILLADQMLYNNAHRCLIWQAFARRGMGFQANQGSANVAGDETENFSLPSYCMPATQPPVAAFTANQTTIACGGTVQFTDQSVQAFDWLWDFGDQVTSTFQNPAHTYTSPGTYTVQLTVTNPLGTNTLVKPNYITVTSTFTVTVTTSTDTICNGDTVLLSATASGSNYINYTVNSIPYAPLSGTGTTVALSDDQMSTVKPIGFTFNFSGQNYTNFYICSNGFITFSAGMPASYYSQIIPSTVTPNNFIALAWNDLNPSIAGSVIDYFNTGVALNRKLIVRYNTYHYGGTAYPFIMQAILSEGSNEIEIHTQVISNVSGYDAAGTTTQGVENQGGTTGIAVPGRNSTHFNTTNTAYRFVPYVPYAYSWQPGNLNGPAQSVTPSTTGNYTVTATDGSVCTVSVNSPVITVNNCTINLQLKAFIEGFYNGGNSMVAVVDPVSYPTLCDTITVELHADTSPYGTIYSNTGTIDINGNGSFVFPGDVQGNSYYIVIKHRNAIETWSKVPVTIGFTTNYDCTIPD